MALAVATAPPAHTAPPSPPVSARLHSQGEAQREGGEEGQTLTGWRGGPAAALPGTPGDSLVNLRTLGRRRDWHLLAP